MRTELNFICRRANLSRYSRPRSHRLRPRHAYRIELHLSPGESLAIFASSPARTVSVHAMRTELNFICRRANLSRYSRPHSQMPLSCRIGTPVSMPLRPPPPSRRVCRCAHRSDKARSILPKPAPSVHCALLPSLSPRSACPISPIHPPNAVYRLCERTPRDRARRVILEAIRVWYSLLLTVRTPAAQFSAWVEHSLDARELPPRPE
jgi:hypothetical protein